MNGERNDKILKIPQIFGRDSELQYLSRLGQDSDVQVVFVVGIPGVGCSTLLRSLQAHATRTSVFYADCRTIEPTEKSFHSYLQGLGYKIHSTESQILCLDHYDHFLLLDSWLRDEFLAASRGNTRLVIASRQASTFAWRCSPFRTKSMRLDVLDQKASLELLAHGGISSECAQDIWNLTGGHPLALRLAHSNAGHSLPSSRDALDPTELVHELAMYFLQNEKSPFLREAIEAMSAVRRITPRLLSAMLAKPVSDEQFDSLVKAPVVDIRSDGLSLYPTVQQAIARWLRATDPSRFTAYRQAAWRIQSDDARKVGERDTWRYTADVIYLIDDPAIREAFFPTGSQAYSLEIVKPEDTADLLRISEKHDGPEGRQLLSQWISEFPESLRVAKNATSEVKGFYCLYDPSQAPESVLEKDPVAKAWVSDIPANLKGDPLRVLFLRRWLMDDEGDVPSPGQAACWLDVKRSYLQCRPRIQRVYAAVVNAEPFGPALEKLGFQPCQAELPFGFNSAYLDFGVGSVDAWFAQLVGKSLGLQDLASLNADTMGLELDGRFIPLTPTEFSLVKALLGKSGSTLNRDELLKEGWQGGSYVGSNVVDVAIRGLRKKLGERASLIETVRGAGYRWVS